MPTPSPPIQSRRRTSDPRGGRFSEAHHHPRHHVRSLSRSRSQSADRNDRHRRRYDDRKEPPLGRREGDNGHRNVRRSVSSSGSEAARPRTRTRRSRSRSRDRSRDQPRTKGSARAASAARSGMGKTKDRRIRDPSPLQRRRDTSRDRYTEKDRRPRDVSREPYRRPQSRSRERRPRDTAIGKELKPRNDSRERRPKLRSRSRDRSRDRRKRRHSRSRSPYRAAKGRDRSDSPRRRRSGSPSHKDKRVKARSPSPPPIRKRGPLPSQEMSFRGGPEAGAVVKEEVVDKQKPNFAPTGLLAREANKVTGTNISLKYHEPPEARKPPASAQWRIFVFKGKDTLDTIELYTRSVWLLGRAPEVADILLAHPSSSQQHAAIQFRYIVKRVEDEFGVTQKKGKVKPYIIDLESSNGTMLNGDKLEAGRYFELRDGDLLKFGGSDREYVIMLPPPDKV